MAQPGVEQKRSSEHALGWRTYAGKRVAVHAPEGSYAARRAPAELHEAERAAEALEKLLEPPEGKRGAGRVDIYLTDPVVELPAGISAGEPTGNGREAPGVPGETVAG